LASSKVKNIIKDSELLKSEIKRHDYKTQTIIKIADGYNKEENFRWIGYDEFYSFEKSVISELNGNKITNDNIINTINEINNIIEENSNSNIKKNEASDIDDIEDIESYENENINEENSFENDKISFKNGVKIEQDKNTISFNSIEDFLIDKDINILNQKENNEKESEYKEIGSVKEKLIKFNYPKPKKRNYNELKKNSKEKIYPKFSKNKKLKTY